MSTNTPSLSRQCKAEGKKLHGRYLWLVPAGFLGILFLWILWMFYRSDTEDLAQGYHSLFYQLPMLNAIMMPILIAVMASRLCDMEIKGNTLKLLYTLQDRGRFYHCKFLFGLKYLLLYVAGETCLILLAGGLFHFTEPLDWTLFAWHFLTTFTVGAMLLSLQQFFSLQSENQIFPLILGLVGSFLGLFSLYFPKAVSSLVLWSYFAAFTPIGMDWDSSTRITTFYDCPIPVKEYLCFLLFTLVFYLAGQWLFRKKEV